MKPQRGLTITGANALRGSLSSWVRPSLMRARIPFCLLVALTARGETTLTLADLPSKSFCLVFTLEIDAKEFSKSKSRHEVHAVNGAQWRLEVISEAEKGFVATYDGEKLRSSNRKLDGATLDRASDIAPCFAVADLGVVDHSTPMKRIGLFFLLAMGLQSLTFAEGTKLTREQVKTLLGFRRCHEVLSATNLPPTIVTLCADDGGRLAGPGQKWEATDVIADPSLPRKRLIWAVAYGEDYVVHYERGGRSHSFHILFATLAKGDSKPKVGWRAVGGPFKDYAAFLSALGSIKLDDKLDDAH